MLEFPILSSLKLFFHLLQKLPAGPSPGGAGSSCGVVLTHELGVSSPSVETRVFTPSCLHYSLSVFSAPFSLLQFGTEPLIFLFLVWGVFF